LRSWPLCNILSDGRMGLSFTIAAGSRQRSYSRVRVPRYSWPHFTHRFETPPTWRARSPYLHPPGTGWASYTPRHWVPFSSPPTTRRATVEVLEPAPTRGLVGLYRLRTDRIENGVHNSSIVVCVSAAAETCLTSHCFATDKGIMSQYYFVKSINQEPRQCAVLSARFHLNPKRHKATMADGQAEPCSCRRQYFGFTSLRHRAMASEIATPVV
jgi:hypothetical protein